MVDGELLPENKKTAGEELTLLQNEISKPEELDNNERTFPTSLISVKNVIETPLEQLVKSGEKVPLFQEEIITKKFITKQDLYSWKAGMPPVDPSEMNEYRISGFLCALGWSVDESYLPKDETIPWTVTNIFYLDQQLAFWFYMKLLLDGADEKYKGTLLEKILSKFGTIFQNIFELGLSVKVPQILLELGLIAGKTAGSLGVAISVLFIFFHAFENTVSAKY